MEYTSNLLRTGSDETIEESKLYSAQVDQSGILVIDFCDKLKAITKENVHESNSVTSTASR